MNKLDTLDVNGAAKYLKCSNNTVRSKAKSGEIPSAKIGKCYVFLVGELANWIRQQYSEALNYKESGICQLKNAKDRPIINSDSHTKDALTVLRLARQTVKKRN